MKRFLKLLIVIVLNVAIVTVLIFAFKSYKKEEMLNAAKEGADLSKYVEVELHENYVGSLYNENFGATMTFVNGYAPIAKDFKWGFIDKNGKMITGYEYNEALYFSEGLAPVRKDDKWGYINEKGEVAIDFIYDSVSAFEPETKLAWVIKDNKAGLIDTTGKFVVDLIYDKVGMFNEGMATVLLDGKMGCIDKEGNVVVDIKYDRITKFSNGLACVQLNKKLGFIDKENNIVVPLEYTSAVAFDSDYTFVKKENEDNFIVINKNNEIISKIECDSVSPIVDGVAIIEKDEMYNLVDIYGNKLSNYEYEDYSEFSEGLLAVQLDEMWGFVDTKGELVIPCVFDEVGDFSNGIVNACYAGSWGFIDTKGEVVLPFKYNVSTVTNFNEGYAAVYADGFNCGFLNEIGEFVIGNITEKIIDYTDMAVVENYASMKKDGKWGLYDKNGNLLIDHIYDEDLFVREERICTYDSETGLYGVLDVNGNIIADFKYDKVFEYTNGMAIYSVVNENDEEYYYGFLDSEGNEITEAIYTGAWDFSTNGTATVEKDGEYFVINKKGETISNALTNYLITPFSNDLAGFEDFSELCGYVNLDGQVVIEPIYYDVNEFNEYGTAMVEDADEKMWLIDTKGNKVTDVGYDNMSRYICDGLIKVEKDGLFGYIDYNGNVVVEPQYKDAKDFSDGLASVMKDKLYGYIDTKGNLVLDHKYLLAQDFNDGLTCVCDDYTVMTKNMYIIDKEGNKMFDVNKYQFVYGFMGGICYVEDANGECGVINKEGKLIIGNFDN